MDTNDTTTSSANQAYQIKSDAAGNWNMVIDKKVAPGPHVVTVQDDRGNETQAIMYILDNGQAVQTQTPIQNIITVGTSVPQVVDRMISITPPFLFYALALMAIMIIILIINALRLNKQAKHRGKKKVHGLNYLLLAIIAIIMIVTLIASFGYRANRFWNWGGQQQQQNQTMEVSGRLINPLTSEGADGADLVSGNTSIRTNVGGQFQFSNVTADGILLTHPNLLRAFALLPNDSSAKQSWTIYFDVNLYNTLIKVIDLEARGNNLTVYDLLAPQIKEKITADQYQSSAQSIYTPADINDQQINLLQTSWLDNYEAKAYGLKFDKVVRLKAAANGATSDYYFVFNGTDGWWLIK